MTAPAAATTNTDGTRSYRIPNATSGQMQELPSITAALDVIHAFGLGDWKLRRAMVGTAMRLDLQAQVVAAHHMDDAKGRRAELKRLVDPAIDAGSALEDGFLKNDFGSALHLLTEQVDEGRVDIMSLPANVAEYMAAYVERMTGVEVVHSEFTVVSDLHQYAGTGDRIVRFTDPTLIAAGDEWDLGVGCFVLDIKTGSVYDKVAMQLAGLVNAEAIFDAETQTRQPLPEDLRRDVGFVLDLKDGKAKLIPAELNQAWPAFVGALAVKAFCCTKPLGKPLPKVAAPAAAVPGEVGWLPGAPTSPATPAPAKHPFDDADEPVHISVPAESIVTDLMAKLGESVDQAKRSRAAHKAAEKLSDDAFAGLPDDNDKPMPDRAAKTEYLFGRLKDLLEHDPNAAMVWPAGVPKFPEMVKAGDLHTITQLAAIEQAIDEAEAASRAPFPDIDPSEPRNQVLADTDPRRTDLTTRIAALPPDLLAVVETAAKAANVPGLRTGRVTEAHVHDLLAVLEPTEAVLAERVERVEQVMTIATEKNVSWKAIAETLGVTEMAEVHDGHLQVLDNLIDTIDLGIIVEGRMPDGSGDGHLSVDQPGVVLAKFHNRRKDLLAAAKTAAVNLGRPKPSNSEEALDDPILTSALAVA